MTRGAFLSYSSSGNTPHPYDPRERYPRIWVKRDDPLPEEVDQFLKTTPREAWERAENILKEMGLSDSFQVAAIRLMPDVDWEVSSLGRTITKGIKGYSYQAHFSRMVCGVPCNSTQRYSVYLFQFKDLTSPSWQPEQMEPLVHRVQDLIEGQQGAVRHQHFVRCLRRGPGEGVVRAVIEPQLHLFRLPGGRCQVFE